MTRTVGDQLDKLQLDDWIASYRRREMRWAGHVLRRDDGRWSTKVLDWIPEINAGSHGRKQGRPCKKREQDFFGAGDQ